ncbi:uncharacterized protein LOC103718706 [Phoenix dactylifera]|uniref:Uncharacterized protein LOC103718706 n=1 Tax=Phoenix dactylifera TaxID=42345 RepID=A0A8B8JAT1_PHODC|nr:uncharacterized protein LOC103718706 [Phoenix dactylifera]
MAAAAEDRGARWNDHQEGKRRKPAPPGEGKEGPLAQRRLRSMTDYGCGRGTTRSIGRRRRPTFALRRFCSHESGGTNEGTASPSRGRKTVNSAISLCYSNKIRAPARRFTGKERRGVGLQRCRAALPSLAVRITANSTQLVHAQKQYHILPFLKKKIVLKICIPESSKSFRKLQMPRRTSSLGF